VTLLQAYVYFGIPLVLLGMGALVYFVTGWSDRRSGHPSSPKESRGAHQS
jgi:hypothetical protein